MRHAAWAGLVLAVALIGCRHADITPLASAPPKPADCTPQLFDSEAAVGRPFEAVCMS